MSSFHKSYPGRRVMEKTADLTRSPVHLPLAKEDDHGTGSWESNRDKVGRGDPSSQKYGVRSWSGTCSYSHWLRTPPREVQVSARCVRYLTLSGEITSRC